MKLFIDTTEPELVRLRLEEGEQTSTHEFLATRNLSERLILEIQKFLKLRKAKASDLTGIEASSGRGGFSRIRTAVATANALVFGLNLKQKLAQPHYDRPPNITKAKRT